MKKVAKKEYVDIQNKCIWDINRNGNFRIGDVFESADLKNCKSALITILKVGVYTMTIEITSYSQIVFIDNVDVYFNLDKTNGRITTVNANRLSGTVVYNDIYVRK